MRREKSLAGSRVFTLRVKIRSPCALQASLQIFGRRMRTYIPRLRRGIGSKVLPQPTQKARRSGGFSEKITQGIRLWRRFLLVPLVCEHPDGLLAKYGPTLRAKHGIGSKTLPQPQQRARRWRALCCGWGSRIRTYECQSQSLVPYRLAIPHCLCSCEHCNYIILFPHCQEISSPSPLFWCFFSNLFLF